MPTVWYLLLTGTIAVYAVLDGFDLGVGIVHRLVARTREERGALVHSIGPVWDGNEVWLIAAGATLLLAFPAAYASAFSGFYLPLMMVLWLLIGRACAVELRRQVEGVAWQTFWDAIFFVSSLLLALAFGAALGNVLRGVPLGDDGTFFEPLWTHGGVDGATGVFDWYTLLIGLTVVVALAFHGAVWTAHKHEGEVRDRARAWAARLWLPVGATTLVAAVATMGMWDMPRGWLGGALAAGGVAAAAWAGTFYLLHRGRDTAAFAASSVYVVASLASAALAQYPYLLPHNQDDPSSPRFSHRVPEAAASPHALEVGLWWWIPGILLAIGGQVVAYRAFRGKFRPDGHG